MIGNGDRHQENWAMISKQQLLTDVISDLEKAKQIKLSKRQKSTVNWLKKQVTKMKGQKLPKIWYQIDLRFAPIYDSGSSLGRELVDDKVEAFLRSNEMINRYISKGQSEIHWEGNKLTHFDLITNLLNMPVFQLKTKTVINRIIEKWNGTDIAIIIKEVDLRVPESHQIYKIPDSRKQLILKLITLRYERLKELI